MKLLFDQNISFRILKKIDDHFPNSSQVRILKLDNSGDFEIWKYAKLHHYTIVTFDADFYDIANLKGHPPKIVWLRTGNSTTSNISRILIEKKEIIQDFIHNKEYSNLACLEISN